MSVGDFVPVPGMIWNDAAGWHYPVTVQVGEAMPMPPYCDANGMKRIAELDAALRSIVKFAVQADDPEHHTLSLCKFIAAQAVGESVEQILAGI